MSKGLTMARRRHNFNSPPPQATVAGFTTLTFFDDFTSAATITANGSATYTAGVNWYPSHGITISSPTNYTLHTTQLASQVSNGNTSGGTNASPSGGIMQMFGVATVTNQVVFQGIPQSIITDRTSSNLYGPEGYWEVYSQCNATGAPEHQGHWINAVTTANEYTEVDIIEVGSAAFGDTNWHLGSLNEWVGGSNVTSMPSNATIPATNEWHTFGVLIKATSGGQGLMSTYLDNVLVGSITVGTGTSWPAALADANGSVKRVWLIGKDLGTGVNSINVDWVRYWSH